MSDANPIDLLFAGLRKLGPGSDADTSQVLDMLPERVHGMIVDAGCGTGRSTLVLAKRLQTLVHAVDSYEPFLRELDEHAEQAGLAHLVRTHCMDMSDIPQRFEDIDLLWSEGAAYTIGFPHALQTWHSALKPRRFVVVSELCWLREDAPLEVRQFFRSGYPGMRTVQANQSAAREAGYEVLAQHTLPREAWIEGYYEILVPRAQALLDHADPCVQDFAAETLEEIRIFGRADDSYAYVFFVLRKI